MYVLFLQCIMKKKPTFILQIYTCTRKTIESICNQVRVVPFVPYMYLTHLIFNTNLIVFLGRCHHVNRVYFYQCFYSLSWASRIICISSAEFHAYYTDVEINRIDGKTCIYAISLTKLTYMRFFLSIMIEFL